MYMCMCMSKCVFGYICVCVHCVVQMPSHLCLVQPAWSVYTCVCVSCVFVVYVCVCICVCVCVICVCICVCVCVCMWESVCVHTYV